ncbi:hypothetical protein [Sandaracinus amylolyticus]|uniref:hypothetical protein n=1 Tax=Sandaracinus amylolyticus TaxID=927083 RepID=UPI001F3F190D|nr:hypothetical protein [Sandaracinus amylolyticus]UJR85840.1 Hypothetical protein I5071_79200 [Sandaracinus amylolyticus]
MKTTTMVVISMLAIGALGCRGEDAPRQPSQYGRWIPIEPTDQPASAPGARDDPQGTTRLGTLDPTLSGGEPSPFARPDEAAPLPAK